MLTAALARISILEKTRDISYRDGFKAASQACIVRGCERKFVSHENVLRHLKESSTPQHQVAAIILGQTSCLQCDKDFKWPTKLKTHELDCREEAYTSTIEAFSPFFEQYPCMYLALIVLEIRSNSLQTFRIKSSRTSLQKSNPISTRVQHLANVYILLRTLLRVLRILLRTRLHTLIHTLLRILLHTLLRTLLRILLRNLLRTLLRTLLHTLLRTLLQTLLQIPNLERYHYLPTSY